MAGPSRGIETARKANGDAGSASQAVAAVDNRIFPDNFGAGGDLAERNHAPSDRAPNLQAIDEAGVLALGARRAGNDWEQPRLLRIDAGAAATRLAKETDDAAFEAGREG